MTMDKTVRKVTDPAKQQEENYRYWQSRTVGERLNAVWELSAAAYAFASSFKGLQNDDAAQSNRTITRVQRAQR